MLEDLKLNFKYHPAFTAVILILFVVLWSTLYMDIHIDVDTSWLLQCLDRFLAGGTYKTDFYETNPPLSFLIYLPAYPLYTYWGLDPKFSVFIIVNLYIVFSSYVLYMHMKEGSFNPTDIVVILFGYILALTWASGISYGSKDHLITAFLIPLCFYQYRLTREESPHRFTAVSSVFLGGLAICLKPHYGIIAAAFFVHRLYITKSILTCIKKPDFWGLLIIGVAYIAFVFAVTPGFFEILPEIISIYSVERPFPLYYRYYYVLYGLVGFILAFWLFKAPSNQNLKHATIGFSALSALSLIPYILQDKGFHYQALPTLCFGSVALFIAIYGIAKEILEKEDLGLWAAAVIIIVLFSGFTYGYKDPKMTKGQFLALPLVDAIDEKAWNNVYATYDFKNLIIVIPKVSALKNGSRFGQLWPLNGLVEKLKTVQDDDERQVIKKQMLGYVDMIVEDMRKHKPSVITIPQFKDPETEKPAKKYYEFLMNHEEFKKNMDNYTYDSTVLFDSSLSLKNSDPDKIIPHDVFVLKRDHSL